jgi:hypothetical protein
MKTTTVAAIALGAVAGFVVAGVLVSKYQSARSVAQLAEQHSAWQAEKAALESALEQARNTPPAISTVAAPVQTVTVTNRASASEILDRLKAMRAGTNSVRNSRRVVHEFESLIDLGPMALPDIRQFLAQNLDIEYDPGGRRAFREGRIPTEFSMPPSLRLGLLEVARNVGGEAGEQVLAEVLKNTGRGAELAYAAYALQEITPNKHRATALAAAKDLLARPLAPGSASQLDKSDRDCLYAVLTFFNDTTYAATAQAQIVQPDGKVDPVAVRYLQTTLGEQSIALAAQSWQDPRIAADQKEPLARVALAYAGLNPQADQLYQTAINDPNLPADHRRNLIEDLNEAGFADAKHLTQADLPLIQKRIGIIEQLAPNAIDQVNAKAFKEAYKDLVNMQNSLLPKPAPAK